MGSGKEFWYELRNQNVELDHYGEKKVYDYS